MRKALKMLPWIIGAWLVSSVFLGILLGKMIDLADEIELGDIDD